MGGAAKPRFAVTFLMILTVFLSLGLPAEDVLDAVYDESESVPYEVTPLFSIAVRQAASLTHAPLSSFYLTQGTPSPIYAAPARDADVNRCAGARISLALLCTLLC